MCLKFADMYRTGGQNLDFQVLFFLFVMYSIDFHIMLTAFMDLIS